MSAQTNVADLVAEGGVCIVPNNLPESAGGTNVCALSPDEAGVLRGFFLLLNEWDEAEGHHGD